MKQYQVTYYKRFVSGALKGIEINTTFLTAHNVHIGKNS